MSRSTLSRSILGVHRWRHFLEHLAGTSHSLYCMPPFLLRRVPSGPHQVPRRYTTLTAGAQQLLSLVPDSQSLLQTKQLHAVSTVTGFLPSTISLCASLILRYARFHDPRASRSLFEQALPSFSRSSFLWNTFIRALYTCRVSDGFGTYNWMVRSGVRPDDHTVAFVLKACADGLEFEKGLEVHGVVFKAGFDSDVFVGNTLLLFYGNYGRLEDAEKVFDEMADRDVVSWNSVIGAFSVNGCFSEAVGLFKEMALGSDVRPNLVTVVTVLPVCAALEDEVTGRRIHCCVVKAGLDCFVVVGNALIDAYGKCGEVRGSRRVFDEMAVKNDVSWNSVITSLAYRGKNLEALEAFRSMVGEEVRPNSVTISSILPVLVELELFNLGKEVHGLGLRLGVGSDVFINNSLIDMYAKSGHPHKASKVFYHMHGKSVVSWNSMVANFALNRLELPAVELVRQMQAEGEMPNSITFTNVLPACAREGLLLQGREIHARAIRTGCSSELFVSNALIDMYGKCGCLILAQNVFDISFKDEVSYNILIIGYSQTADCLESLRLFSEMGLLGIKQDEVSFVGAVSACANLAALIQGKEIHGNVIRNHLHSHLFVANSLLDMYTKCGRINIAHQVFDRIMDKDSASWNCMILGYGRLGEYDIALDLFEEMKKDGRKCDSVSYVAVLSACSHGGLVEKGKQYFKEMHDQHILPTNIHYACMIDLLGRAGHIEEAVQLIKTSLIEPDTNVWGALLGACRIHGDLELASWAAEHLFKLRPQHSGYYATLSNMYAEAGKWDEATSIRERMVSSGAKKNPGYSWVRVDGRVHAFVAGDRMMSFDPDLCLASS